MLTLGQEARAPRLILDASNSYAQRVLRGDQGLRVLGPADLPQVRTLLAADPVTNVFVDYRAMVTSLDKRWLGGEMWGWYSEGRLRSVCHSAANLVPAMADPEAAVAFARRAERHARGCATLVGPVSQVRRMWDHLEHVWEAPRDERWDQPHLVIDHDPLLPPDRSVRRTRPDEIGELYPASVAMYTEEVGVSPLDSSGSYPRYVRLLMQLGRAIGGVVPADDARRQPERVWFKSDIGSVWRHYCQVQGVWLDPQLRGRGLSIPAMAQVVVLCQQQYPVVSLYVNDFNTRARRLYTEIGFDTVGELATVLY